MNTPKPDSERETFVDDSSEITALISDIFSSDKVQIKTAPTEELMVYLEENIVAGEKGCVIEAPFRNGKNSGIRFNLKKLPEFLGHHIGWCELSASWQTKDEKKPFVGRVLSALGHEDPWTGRPQEIFDRLVAHLVARCDESPLKCFVLWFDDVHTFRLSELYWIFDISNAMDKRAKLFIILSMPPMVDGLKAKLREHKRGDIVQRFTLDPFKFRGLKTKAELHDVLDRFSNYSDGERPSISEIFKRKTRKDYNLSDLTDAFWLGFRKRWRKHLDLKKFELGMKWPCSAAARVVLKVHSREWDGLPRPDEIEHALNTCGFSGALEDLV